MSETIDSLYDSRSDFVEEITKSSAAIDKDLSRMSIGEVLTIDQLIDRSVQEMEESQDSIRLGVQTGIPEIDAQLGYKGLAFGEINVIICYVNEMMFYYINYGCYMKDQFGFNYFFSKTNLRQMFL